MPYNEAHVTDFWNSKQHCWLNCSSKNATSLGSSHHRRSLLVKLSSPANLAAI